MFSARLMAQFGLAATLAFLGLFVAIVAVGSAKCTISDLRAHGTAITTGQPLHNNLSGTLAVAPHQ